MMADEGDLGDDVGWWNCSLCTFKNSADKFKCDICDLRRGTSTRKPRCNADTIVAQVVKQQEQIRQQTRSKPSPKSSNPSTTPSTLEKPIIQITPSHSSSPHDPTSSTNVPVVKTTTENPFKIAPIKISGNLIKYSPPTSTGRTGLIIDKKKFTQHSVTVNDVTITFTEFATRQNKYIRKKKRRDDNRSRGNGPSSSKSEPKISSSNNASTAPTSGDS